ncbi:MAG: cell division protein FtsB [Gammaproteobacteria bacterium]
MARCFAGVLAVALVLLQYRMWLSDDGVSEMLRLAQAVEVQKATNDGLRERNAQLAAEVADLKDGLTALEERARSELGMVAPDETFYQVVPRVRQATATAAAAAPAVSAAPVTASPPARPAQR